LLNMQRWSHIIRYMAKYKSNMQSVMSILKALGDENRTRVVMALMKTGELCVCQITELLGLAPSTVSRHLSILTQAGLIESHKKGRWVHYRIAENEAGSMINAARVFVWNALLDDAKIARDARHMNEILKKDPELLCLRQKGK